MTMQANKFKHDQTGKQKKQDDNNKISTTNSNTTSTTNNDNNSSRKPSKRVNVKVYMIIISIIDVIGGIASLLGTIWLGSGLYQVIYSSQLVCSAILSKYATSRF